MADSGNPKRARGEEEEEDEEEGERGEGKRLRAEELLEILDGDDAAAAEELASVMRSFEEEIAAAPASAPQQIATTAEVAGDGREMDLGYLLEASDDELGLPPTTTTTTTTTNTTTTTTTTNTPTMATTVAEDTEAAAAEEEGVGGLVLGFGEMWGFEDEIGGCYEGFGFGMGDAAEAAAEHGAGAGAGAGAGGMVVLGFDGGLFDYSDVVCGPSDLADLSWRSESLPAV